MFSTSGNGIAPPDGKSYVRPCYFYTCSSYLGATVNIAEVVTFVVRKVAKYSEILILSVYSVYTMQRCQTLNRPSPTRITYL